MEPMAASLDELLEYLAGLPASANKVDVAVDELQRLVTIPLLWPWLIIMLKVLVPICAISFIARSFSLVCILREGGFWLRRNQGGLCILNSQLICTIVALILALIVIADFIVRIMYDSGVWSPKYVILFEALQWVPIFVLECCYGYSLVVLSLRLRRTSLCQQGQTQFPRATCRYRTLLDVGALIVLVIIPLTAAIAIVFGNMCFVRAYELVQDIITKLRVAEPALGHLRSIDDLSSLLMGADKAYRRVNLLGRMKTLGLEVAAGLCSLLLLVAFPFWFVQLRLLFRMMAGHWTTFWRSDTNGLSVSDAMGGVQSALPISIRLPNRLHKTESGALTPATTESELSCPPISGGPAIHGDSAVHAIDKLDEPCSTNSHFRFSVCALMTLLILGYVQAIVFVAAGFACGLLSLHSQILWNIAKLVMVEAFFVMGVALNMTVVGVPVSQILLRKRDPSADPA